MMTLEEAVLTQATTGPTSVTWFDIGVLFAVLAFIIFAVSWYDSRQLKKKKRTVHQVVC
jgi:flagellar biogenesis protein FliO